ncbi:predicted protein [Naegleria gruberi]|uniref:Predicted protein n=1 Tax=Naegleria gruberi TaxID=5762 RepID=D2V4E8_NAEGR|nr:uncharacterized protein NAEGRDRAFT_63700 [Naegleria gruberi]EFC48501.1 predicted protein [Naegleria gruberi]|eukprot:XP_002681245.1 predicted protein [Naegleria gruberi strain NEG-M]
MKYILFVVGTLLVCIMSMVIHAENPHAGQVQHIVAFRYEANVTQSDKDQIMKTYFSLKERCVNPETHQPYILSFDGGYPNSPEGFDQKMEQIYIVTFKNVQDRDYFVGRPFHFPYDPLHDAFKNFVGPFLRKPIETGLIVMDFQVLNKP